MKISEARAIAGSIGYPSKMPGTSYGISAKHCLVGAKLANVPGSTCAGCYALKGRYYVHNVAKAHAARERNLGSSAWVVAMVELPDHAHEFGQYRHLHHKRGYKALPRYHRWHDSGDLQSVEHLAAICAVATATPYLKHWLPTREHAIVKAYLATGCSIPDNLTIRISATMVDGMPTAHWPTTSTVHKRNEPLGRECPAPTQGNKCGDCRACWLRDVTNVSYHQH